jgi:hypothetical protein
MIVQPEKAARHARIALDAITATQGKMHWMCTYATDRKLFGVVVAENEQVIDDYVRNAGIERNLKNSPRYSCSRSIGCGASFQLSPLERVIARGRARPKVSFEG